MDGSRNKNEAKKNEDLGYKASKEPKEEPQNVAPYRSPVLPASVGGTNVSSFPAIPGSKDDSGVPLLRAEMHHRGYSSLELASPPPGLPSSPAGEGKLVTILSTVPDPIAAFFTQEDLYSLERASSAIKLALKNISPRIQAKIRIGHLEKVHLVGMVLDQIAESLIKQFVTKEEKKRFWERGCYDVNCDRTTRRISYLLMFGSGSGMCAMGVDTAVAGMSGCGPIGSVICGSLFIGFGGCICLAGRKMMSDQGEYQKIFAALQSIDLQNYVNPELYERTLTQKTVEILQFYKLKFDDQITVRLSSIFFAQWKRLLTLVHRDYRTLEDVVRLACALISINYANIHSYFLSFDFKDKISSSCIEMFIEMQKKISNVAEAITLLKALLGFCSGVLTYSRRRVAADDIWQIIESGFAGEMQANVADKVVKIIDSTGTQTMQRIRSPEDRLFFVGEMIGIIKQQVKQSLLDTRILLAWLKNLFALAAADAAASEKLMSNKDSFFHELIANYPAKPDQIREVILFCANQPECPWYQKAIETCDQLQIPRPDPSQERKLGR